MPAPLTPRKQSLNREFGWYGRWTILKDVPGCGACGLILQAGHLFSTNLI